MIGSPVIIEHQDVTDKNADKIRCGVISDAYFYEPDGWYYAEGIIWDDKAISLINDGWSVSCSYDFLAFNDEGGEENNIKYDKEFTELNFTHLAIVNNPRYERANIILNSKDDFLKQFTDVMYEALEEALYECNLEQSINNEKWVTIKGNHILLKDGESLADAFKRHTGVSLSKGNDYEKKKDIKSPSKEYTNILETVKESNKSNITPDDIIASAIKTLDYSSQEIKDKISEADEYNEGIKKRGLETYLLHSDGEGIYKRDRAELHKKIIKDIFKNAKSAKPKEGEQPKFVVLGGRGGSGKSKFNGLVYDKENFVVLDADAIKEKLPEYRGYNAFEVHEESSDILKQALKKARKKGINVVLDGTLKTLSSSEKNIKSFLEKGYDIEMYYMHLPREKSAERAIGRFMGDNGRYVPLNVLLDMKENEQNFDKLKKYASKWAFYNNDVPSKDDKPILVDKNY